MLFDKIVQWVTMSNRKKYTSNARGEKSMATMDPYFEITKNKSLPYIIDVKKATEVKGKINNGGTLC